MTLHPVTDGPRKNRFCGPAALSAITGQTTDETAAMLRRVTGKRSIMGTWASDLLRALQCFGFTAAVVIDFTEEPMRPTLARWLKDTTADRTTGRVFLISAGHHWQVVSGRRFVDSKTRSIVSIRDPKVHRRARVRKVWEVLPC